MRQQGAATRAQAFEHGYSPDAVRARLASGRWQRVHPGVYVVHSGPIGWLERAWAAVLAVGPDGVLSLRSAGYLDGLVDDAPEPIDVCVPRDGWRTPRLTGVRLHCSSRLPGSRHPSRTPPRTRIEHTVLDLAAVSRSADDAAGWVVRGCQRRLTTVGRLRLTLDQRSRTRWRRVVTAMLADVDVGAQSPLEVEHLRRVERAHGLPTGHRQARIVGRSGTWIDVAYVAFALLVELDGRLGHVDDGQVRDRRRDNRGVVDGFATLRYGWQEVFGDPCGVAGEQARVLRRRGWRGQPRRCGPGCSVDAC